MTPAVSIYNSVRLLAAALLALPGLVHAEVAAPPEPPTTTQGAAANSPGTVTAPADTVLIRNGVTTLTRGDYDLELTRLPPDVRGGFGADPSRVNTLLNRLLVTKTLAAQARQAGLDKDPTYLQRMAWEAERLLSAAYIESIEAEAAKEFDARPNIAAAARERWIADANKYRTAETVSVTHILFDLSKHTKDEALKLAQDARAKVVAGADMSQLASEISEDPSASRNGGRLENMKRDQLDPAFTRAAFALAKPGDVSEPVLSRFGYHVIRLESRTPAVQRTFPEVKDEIIAELRRQYVDQRRNERLAAIRNDPQILVNQPAVDALVRRADQEEFRKAMNQPQRTNGDPTPAVPGATPK